MLSPAKSVGSVLFGDGESSCVAEISLAVNMSNVTGLSLSMVPGSSAARFSALVGTKCARGRVLAYLRHNDQSVVNTMMMMMMLMVMVMTMMMVMMMMMMMIFRLTCTSTLQH